MGVMGLGVFVKGDTEGCMTPTILETQGLSKFFLEVLNINPVTFATKFKQCCCAKSAGE